MSPTTSTAGRGLRRARVGGRLGGPRARRPHRAARRRGSRAARPPPTTCSAATTSSGGARSRPPPPPGARRRRAGRALRVLDRRRPPDAGRDEPRHRLVRPRPAAARPRGARLRRARLPADAGRVRARGSRRPARRRPPPRREAAAIGERFGERTCSRSPRTSRATLLIRPGRVERGPGLLDEAMVAVTAGELSPIVDRARLLRGDPGCQEAFELRRAREWTAALTRWCGEQPDMVAFTGRCLVHRAEIMQLHGDWPDALRGGAARRASASRARRAPRAAARGALPPGRGPPPAGEPRRPRRRTGRRAGAGCEPQPGLALLRLAQGEGDAAAAAIRRALGRDHRPARRARALLPACVEIMLAAGDLEAARERRHELERIAARARERRARRDGRARARRGRARRRRRAGALVALRRAGAGVAASSRRRTRRRACGCSVGAAPAARSATRTRRALELDAARGVFARLGAAPDLARLDALAPARPPTPTG